MRRGRGTERRKLSAGTVFMLALLAVVLCGSALVIGRLSSGAKMDLGKLNMNVLDLSDRSSGSTNTGPDEPDESGPKPEKQAGKAQTIRETPVPEQDREGFALTIGGSISLSGEVRKNSRSTDAKVADYADIMMLLAPQLSGDVKGVFLENILSSSLKANDNVAPSEAVTLLKEAGFSLAACGFSQAYAGGQGGVEATLMTLKRANIDALGIRYADDPGDPEVKTIRGVKTAFLQYTATIPAKTRKNMEKEGTSGMVPEADPALIKADIAAARNKGAEAVIVLVNWGKINREPDKAQRELAVEIAAAGADLIVGNGSHVPQGAEYLSGPKGDVLCVWSPGTLLGGDRTNIRRMSGYLLHVTIRRDGHGGAEVTDPGYTPIYTWKYKQDSRFYYRCIAADGETPDGMDNEQRKNMAKAAETVANILKDSPLAAGGQANAD